MSDGDLFKTGFLVLDIEQAMRDFSSWLGVSWTPVQTSPLKLQVGRLREEVDLRFAYSREGPPYLELLEARSAGYYSRDPGPHLHHVGRWVDDLPKEISRLSRAGMKLEAAGIDDEGRTPAMFAFCTGAHGLRVELVDRAMQPNFEGWLEGGALELG